MYRMLQHAKIEPQRLLTLYYDNPDKNNFICDLQIW